MYWKLLLALFTIFLFSACGQSSAPLPPPTPLASAVEAPIETSFEDLSTVLDSQSIEVADAAIIIDESANETVEAVEKEEIVEPTESPNIAGSNLTPAEAKTSEQIFQEMTIQFEPGADSATVQGYVGENQRPSYQLYAFEGQFMHIEMQSPNQDVTMSVFAPHEQHALDRLVIETEWEYYLPSTQTYIVSPIYSGAGTDFSMTVTIRNFPSQPQTYFHYNGNFSFLYPADATLAEFGSPDNLYLNDQIFIHVSETSPTPCYGACPFIEHSEETAVNGYPATKMTGFIGSIGGNTPQEFVKYRFLRGDGYIEFTLFALPTTAPLNMELEERAPITNEDLAWFEEVLYSLQIN